MRFGTQSKSHCPEDFLAIVLVRETQSTAYSSRQRAVGLKSEPNLNPGVRVVESTACNCRELFRKRAADSKHGFESRWGRHGESDLALMAMKVVRAG